MGDGIGKVEMEMKEMREVGNWNLEIGIPQLSLLLLEDK